MNFDEVYIYYSTVTKKWVGVLMLVEVVMCELWESVMSESVNWRRGG